jgi:proline dehydrogenase
VRVEREWDKGLPPKFSKYIKELDNSSFLFLFSFFFFLLAQVQFYFFSFKSLSSNMYRSIARASVPACRLMRPHLVGPPPSLLRSYTTRATTNTIKSPTFPFKTLSASIALTSAMYLYSKTGDRVVEAQGHQPLSAFTTSSPSSALAELNDNSSRIAVQAKSTEELLMGLFVYKLCTFSWLVDAAPHLISLSEKLHLQTPVYWFVKQTFFRQFCGGETPEECVSSMDKLSLSGINCILDLSVEADLHIDHKNQQPSEGQSIYFREEQQADVILNMSKNCIQTAAAGTMANAMAAIKVTAFSPPQLLLRLNQAVTQLEQKFVAHQANGSLDSQGLREVIRQVLPEPSTVEQQQARETIVSRLESNQGTLDVLEFRKLFNLQGPARDIWWKTSNENEKEVLLTSEDLAAYDRMMSRLEQVCSLARENQVGIMVDAEQSYFQDIIDHVAINLQRKFNRRDENEEKTPTVFNTCKFHFGN